MATNLEQAAQEYRDFLPSFRSLCLATVDETGKPDLSYAPHVLSPEGRFYVFLSDLARHTGLLRTSGCASVLLIEAEAQAQEIFARRRISFQCQAEQVERRFWQSLSSSLAKSSRCSRGWGISTSSDSVRNPACSSRASAKPLPLEASAWTNSSTATQIRRLEAPIKQTGAVRTQRRARLGCRDAEGLQSRLRFLQILQPPRLSSPANRDRESGPP